MTDKNLPELLAEFEEASFATSPVAGFTAHNVLKALSASIALNKKLVDGIKRSTEYRTGNPAYEQLVALAKQHGVE